MKEEKMERADASTNGGRFKRICVFCGSSSGNKTAFSDAALDLGKELVKRGIDLVYGGGSVGLMGMVSQTVYNGGCNVLGVIPTALMPREGQEFITVNGLHLNQSENRFEWFVNSLYIPESLKGDIIDALPKGDWKSFLSDFIEFISNIYVEARDNNLYFSENQDHPSCFHIIICNWFEQIHLNKPFSKQTQIESCP